MPLEPNAQQIIDVLADAVKTGIKQFADGFQIWTDIPAFIPVFAQIPEAIKDADHALNYLKDMNEAKEAEVVDAVALKLGDSSPEVKEGARRMLRWLAETYMTILFFSNLQKTANPKPPVK